MSDQARDWMTAASCTEGPRPSVTFSDLPRRYRGEMVRFAIVAAASSAYFVTLVILSRPLPSRSLLNDAALPGGVASRPILLDARLTDLPAPVARVRAPRLRRPVALVALREPPPAIDTVPDEVEAPRRRNVFSRFFRGVFHVQSASTKSNPDAAGPPLSVIARGDERTPTSAR